MDLRALCDDMNLAANLLDNCHPTRDFGDGKRIFIAFKRVFIVALKERLIPFSDVWNSGHFCFAAEISTNLVQIGRERNKKILVEKIPESCSFPVKMCGNHGII